MTIRTFFKKVLTSPNERKFDMRLQARAYRGMIPNDIGLRMQYPADVTTSDAKIIYTLSKEGSVSYPNLLLLTGLPKDVIDRSLDVLTGRDIIAEHSKVINETSDHEEIQIYTLEAAL